MCIRSLNYTYAFEVHFDALRELSVVQNHSYFSNFEHPFDAFGRLIYQLLRVSEQSLDVVLLVCFGRSTGGWSDQ
jgi:hypothetical protein